MKITEFAEYIWSDKQSRYLLLRDKSINWTGPVCLLKGASATQEELQQSEATFYNTMTQDYNTTFGENQAIMSTLTAQLNPIVAAGPNQKGYNGAELNNLNSQALQGTGQSYANASQALKEQQASTGGGNAYLPSGVQSQQQAGLASSAANEESSQLLGIQNADYTQGYSMYQSAMSGLAGVAGLENPAAYSNAATSAAGAANTEANAVTQANDSWAQNLTGLGAGALGGAGAALGGYFQGQCWIAAEIFGGWKDKRTIAVRKWLANEFSQHWYGRMFNRWYSANGRRVAKKIQNNRVERWALRKLFEWFLAQAKKEGVCR
jgi:hypothetical protein